MEILLNIQFWLFFVALIAAIMLMRKMAVNEGYIKGASQGFALGIEETADFLSKRQMVLSTDSKPLTKSELINTLAPLVTAELIKKLNKEK